ncbi:hypothetical protein Cgig2_007554 [Carnegiea gigantea]|uniref:Uncharacterized protein n=1 Tax=Carnegiea gigantea TaxID=171969 RepID=A0A9Q1QCZ9_9CARY|nr:hypothetical protein Cgig2_007554 [Carnegiea gigantea]
MVINGIWAGMRTVRYFDGKTYQWVNVHWDNLPLHAGTKDEWHPLLGPWRSYKFSVFSALDSSSQSIIIYRLILWWLIAIPTIREYNSYLQDRMILVIVLHPFLQETHKEVAVHFVGFPWPSALSNSSFASIFSTFALKLTLPFCVCQDIPKPPMPVWLVVVWTSSWCSPHDLFATMSWHLHRSSTKKRQ